MTRQISRSSLLMVALLANSCATAVPPVVPATLAPIPDSAVESTFAPIHARTPTTDVRPPAVRLLEQSRYSINVHEADLVSILLGLGRDNPLNVVVEPGVSGRVTADLHQVTLLEILDQLVLPRGLHYEVRGRVLRIYDTDSDTRIYRVDYPNYARKGTSDIVMGGAIGSRPGVGAEGGSTDAGELSRTQVETTQTTDLWDEIEKALQNIVIGPDAKGAASDRRVVVSRQSGLITVTAQTHVLRDVEHYLQEVAESTGRQVLIDVQIYEVTLGDDLDLGVDFEALGDLVGDASGVFTRAIMPGMREATIVQQLAPLLTTGGFSFGFARGDFGVILKALAKQTDVRVISTPRITTLNNHKALIKVVRNKVFFVAEVATEVVEAVGVTQTTEFVPHIVPIGVTLDVTPHISSSGEITLHIHPSVSEVIEVVDQPVAPIISGNTIVTPTQAGSLPIIDLRETDTVLRVPDESTVVIGGLIQKREVETEKKVPLLADIPWLGRLFTSTVSREERRELVILLTPHVLDPPRIGRITDEARSSVEGLNDLRSDRVGAHWWRSPLGDWETLQ